MVLYSVYDFAWIIRTSINSEFYTKSNSLVATALFKIKNRTEIHDAEWNNDEINYFKSKISGLPWWLSGKEPPANAEDMVRSLVR